MKYFEIDFGKGVENNRVCIKGRRRPTIREASVFCRNEVVMFGAKVTKVTPIEYNEAVALYDFSNEAKWPIFGSEVVA